MHLSHSLRSLPLAKFVPGFPPDSFPFQGTSTDFQPEGVAIEKNLNKLTVSDEAGVEVTTTPTGRYNTNIKKQSMSDERGIAAESTPSEYVGAQKYKVKKNYSPGNE